MMRRVGGSIDATEGERGLWGLVVVRDGSGVGIRCEERKMDGVEGWRLAFGVRFICFEFGLQVVENSSFGVIKKRNIYYR